MSNLIWIKGERLLNMIDKPIHPEEEIEKLLYNTEGILQDIILIQKRVRSGSGGEIPDLIGVDRENNIIIIELKDEPATADIIPQVLKYALWVESNPDSIRALWLEKKDRPEDFTPEWDNLSVKIKIIAPAFKPEVIRLINKINYDVELTEIKRFIEGDDTFVLFNTLETSEEKPKKIARGVGIYDNEHFYEEEGYNRQSIKVFFRKVEEIKNLVQEKGWNLTLKHNKGYVSFKYGFPMVFGVTFGTTKRVVIFFKMSKRIFEGISNNKKMGVDYDERWKEAGYIVDSPDFDVKKLMPLFEASYEYIVGGK